MLARSSSSRSVRIRNRAKPRVVRVAPEMSNPMSVRVMPLVPSGMLKSARDASYWAEPREVISWSRDQRTMTYPA